MLSDFLLHQFAFIKAAGSVEITELDMLNVSGAGSLSGAFIVQYCSVLRQHLRTKQEHIKALQQRLRVQKWLVLVKLPTSRFQRCSHLNTVMISANMFTTTSQYALLTFTEVGKVKLMLLKISNVAATQTRSTSTTHTQQFPQSRSKRLQRRFICKTHITIDQLQIVGLKGKEQQAI